MIESAFRSHRRHIGVDAIGPVMLGRVQPTDVRLDRRIRAVAGTDRPGRSCASDVTAAKSPRSTTRAGPRSTSRRYECASYRAPVSNTQSLSSTITGRSRSPACTSVVVTSRGRRPVPQQSVISVMRPSTSAANVPPPVRVFGTPAPDTGMGGRPDRPTHPNGHRPARSHRVHGEAQPTPCRVDDDASAPGVGLRHVDRSPASTSSGGTLSTDLDPHRCQPPAVGRQQPPAPHRSVPAPRLRCAGCSARSSTPLESEVRPGKRRA